MGTTTTIPVDAGLKARLAELARQADQNVDQFAEALLRRVADADVRVERGVPVFPRRPGAPTLTALVADRDRSEYVWWPDVVSPVMLPEVRAAATAKQVTDRYLLGLARKNAGRVATFDYALAKFDGTDVVRLLPAVE